jgi:hypothetical protein
MYQLRMNHSAVQLKVEAEISFYKTTVTDIHVDSRNVQQNDHKDNLHAPATTEDILPITYYKTTWIPNHKGVDQLTI